MTRTRRPHAPVASTANAVALPMNDTGPHLPHTPRHALACLMLVFAGHVHAQPVSDPQPAANIPTLDHVQALPPEEERLDLYRLRNPIAVEPNVFDKVYDPGITPEEMALEHGGYINYGINLGLYKSWQGIKKVTGMRPDIQPGIARPPPLTDAQMRRAAKFCEEEGNACPVGK